MTSLQILVTFLSFLFSVAAVRFAKWNERSNYTGNGKLDLYDWEVRK